MAESSSVFENVRAFVSESGEDSRVEVNQRALIDKILARYATPGAVYRELLQNSNDAGARASEIRFSTVASGDSHIVTEVVYRNNGMPFRPQDWSRLRKIAEGNPAADKVGFFGVGAYAMFSICETPMVVSGDEALLFVWKGDALWAKVGKSPLAQDEWTSFILPARDPYPVPDLSEFGSFLCGNLTFLNSLSSIAIFIDGVSVMNIARRIVRPPVRVEPPKATSWWARDGAVLVSPNGCFRLRGAITETIIELRTDIEDDHAEVQANLFSASADVKVNADMKRRLERVTKKSPPEMVNLHIVTGGNNGLASKSVSQSVNAANYRRAKAIVDSFSPQLGNGKIFIGFKTSQSTGLGVHLAAPLIPTVEREAIDLVDPTLNQYNSELLFIGGLLMRLGLERAMAQVGDTWDSEREEREKAKNKNSGTNGKGDAKSDSSELQNQPEEESRKAGGGIFSFARYMASGIKRIADVVSAIDVSGESEDDLLQPKDETPLSTAELWATVLMRCFSPQKSTPDDRVGAFIARGFEGCLPKQAPPVLTQTGIVRGEDGRLPHLGIETFTKENVVRSVVVKNAEAYLRHVARVPRVSVEDMAKAVSRRVLPEEELLLLLRWWCRYARKANILQSDMITKSKLLKESIRYHMDADPDPPSSPNEQDPSGVSLRLFQYYTTDKSVPANLPMPPNVLPAALTQKIPLHVLEDHPLSYWFKPLPFSLWAQFISQHQCLTRRLERDEKVRLDVLKCLSKNFEKLSGQNRFEFAHWLKEKLSVIPCIPHDGDAKTMTVSYLPTDLYLPSAELEFFVGADLYKVSSKVTKNGVTEDFLLALGVRQTVSMVVLFTQLDSLKWNRNPRPLIQFLRKSNLSGSDLEKLRTTRYLPAANNPDEVFAPSDLCLPKREVADLGFIRVLQWPDDSNVTEQSADGQFLVFLGCRPLPRLEMILKRFTQMSPLDMHPQGDKILDFVSDNLGPRGKYAQELSALKNSGSIPFLPTSTQKPLELGISASIGLHAIEKCFLERDCAVMGFPVVESRHKVLAQRCGVSNHPRWGICVQYLSQLAMLASYKIDESKTSHPEAGALTEQEVIAVFWSIFEYLSSRSNTLDQTTKAQLQNTRFIPVCKKNEDSRMRLEWRLPSDVFFRGQVLPKNGKGGSVNNFVESLFDLVEESTFLRAIGVKDEPGAVEMCRRIVANPRNVFEKCGEASYRVLLKRLSSRVEELPAELFSELKKSKCLIALRFDDAQSSSTVKNSPTDVTESDDEDNNSLQSMVVTLETAHEICIVDDSFLQRMFNPPSAPVESDLEHLYSRLGSSPISKLVRKRHEISNPVQIETERTAHFTKRLKERAPLLVSRNVTSRTFVPRVEEILDANSVQVFEVDKITAWFSWNNSKRSQNATCCAQNTLANKSISIANAGGKQSPKKKTMIFITPEIDYFDVGMTVASLVLKKHHLDDAFLFMSLLESPISQLRARGFPVDRVLRIRAEKIPKTAPVATSSIQTPVEQSATASQTSGVHGSKSISNDQGFYQILCLKYPDCDPSHIWRLLQSEQSADKLRAVSRTLEKGGYPKKNGAISKTNSKSDAKTDALAWKSKGGRLIGKAIQGIRGSSSGISMNPLSFGNSGSSSHLVPPQNSAGNTVDSGHEANHHSTLAHSLKRSVESCAHVSKSGIRTSDNVVPAVPELRTSETCEVVEGKDLVPAPGPRKKFRTEHGILVFAAKRNADCMSFLNNPTNWKAIERFSMVLSHLASVFSLKLTSIAIYYDNGGSTIAFNAGRALHFNARYYCSLHDISATPLNSTTLSYWFVIICHELAHNFSQGHGKEHGFYAESFAQVYQPALFAHISKFRLLENR